MLPEAASSTGNSAMPTALPDDSGGAPAATAGAAVAVVRAGEAELAQPGVPLATASGTGASDATLATAPGGLATTATATAQPGVTGLPAAAIFQDGADVRGAQAGLLNVRSRAFPLSSPTTGDAVPAERGQDASTALVAGLWPPTPGMDGDGTGGPDGAACPAEARAEVAARQRAREACFADGSSRANPGDQGEALPRGAAEGTAFAPDAATALALAVVLGGYRVLHQPEGEGRTRRRRPV
jgi:hypothetical protein